ncbi:MAG: MerR family transcriptional regulator [Lentisphaerae bacterium]|nr:MerR family transcriptional regulator [Lentisphaerota bacterium]MCP4102445.1 MerR family transcriptional regulator [Lentisphaerota bacterium]
MENRKNYSIAELSRELDVARTTLNDWMARYSHYIEYENQGRRKVFFDSSLSVLREISALREEGKNSFEIEKELSKRHPFHAEVTGENPEEEKPEEPKMENNNVDESQDAPESTELLTLEQQLLPAVKQQTEEVTKLLSEQFKRLTENMEETRKIADKSAKRSHRWLAVAVALIVCLGALAVVLAVKLSGALDKQEQNLTTSQKEIRSSVDKSSKMLYDDLKGREAKLKEQEAKLNQLAVMLDRNNDNYQDNVKKLQAQLTTQRKSFEDMIKKYSNNVEKQRQATVALLKSDFAAQRLKLLKQIEELKARTGNYEDTEPALKEPPVITKLKAQEAKEDAKVTKSVKKIIKEEDTSAEPEKSAEKVSTDKSKDYIIDNNTK